MNIIYRTVFFIASLLVIGCGGGGGGGGTPGGAEAVLRLYPPIESVGLPVGATGNTGIEVRGGKAPFSITTSDPSVGVRLTDDNTIALSGNGEGTSEVAIYDSSLPVQIVKITVSAKAVPMASSAGEAISLAIGETRTVSLRGGVAPYTVATADASIVTASISGSALTLIGQPKGGTAKVIVTDRVGATFEVSVTVAAVPTPALALTPAAVGGVVGGTNSIQISGGKAPYTVGSSNVSVATATSSGSSIAVALLAVGTSTITVTDSAGASVNATVTVTAAPVVAPALTVLPANQTVLDSSNATVTYLITGGEAPYSVLLSTADAVKHLAEIDNTVTPPVLTMKVQPLQTRCIPVGPDSVVSVDIYDAKLVKKTVTLTVKDDTAAPCV